MACHLPVFRRVRPICVVVALLIVASTPRSARAQSPEPSAELTVRHTVMAELGAVMQAQWLPFARDARANTAVSGERWSTTGRVQSNVAVVAVAEVDGETPLSGWWLRDVAGQLQPWDGRTTAVSAPLGPGAVDVEVHLVAPTGAEDSVPRVRLRMVAAPRR